MPKEKNLETITLTQALSSLSPRSREIALYAFQNPKLTQAEVADHFGISRARISQVLRSNRVLAAFNAMARQKVKNMVPKAVNAVDRLLDMVNEEPETARKAAETILRETKVLGAPEIVVRNQFENMDDSDLRRMLRDAGGIPERIIEGELVEDEPPSDGK